MSRSIDLILKIIESGKPMSAADIAEKTMLSKATVYRTLNRLERQGLINRLNSGVVLPKEPETSFGLRLNTNIDKKREIAEKAVSVVNDGDVVFIDASTTCLAFARELAKSRLSRVSIATNSTFVVNELCNDVYEFYVVCTGGELQPKLNALVGPIACSSIKSMRFHKAFISGAAFSYETGLMTTQTSLAEILRTASSCASETIVLVDSTKFYKEAFLNVLDCDRIGTIISDSGLDSEVKAALESRGVRVL